MGRSGRRGASGAQHQVAWIASLLSDVQFLSRPSAVCIWLHSTCPCTYSIFLSWRPLPAHKMWPCGCAGPGLDFFVLCTPAALCCQRVCAALPHQAFKSYDEAGNARRVQCLKYMVLATMLMESRVDPFDAQEAKPYKQDPEVCLCGEGSPARGGGHGAG